MQEAKRFSTALFGFDRKAVLDYIYEQDKQAREALEELAVRNDTLDRKAAELNEKLEAMSAQYKQAVSDSKEKERQLNEQGSDCARLRERTNKLAAQLRDKENALQLQMELNKKMQARVNEQEAALNSLRAELNEAKLQADLFKGRHEDFNGLKNQLDEGRSLPSDWINLRRILTGWRQRCRAVRQLLGVPISRKRTSRRYIR